MIKAKGRVPTDILPHQTRLSLEEAYPLASALFSYCAVLSPCSIFSMGDKSMPVQPNST